MLVCDDEHQILRALRVILRDAGFEALPASTGEEALDVAAVRRPDAAIIDLVLPDIDGVEVCRRLREWTEMPLIVLSAVGDEDAKVRALAAGADDYVTKPFGPRELIARLQANLRRIEPEPERAADHAPTGSRSTSPRATVRRDGEEVHLTPTEFDLLRAAGAQPRPADDPPRPARRRVGRRLRRRHPGAARPHRQPAAQDRAAGRPATTSAPTRASATGSPPDSIPRDGGLRCCGQGRDDDRGGAWHRLRPGDALARRGAMVAIVDLDRDASERAAAQLPGAALALAADVTDRGAMQRVVATSSPSTAASSGGRKCRRRPARGYRPSDERRGVRPRARGRPGRRLQHGDRRARSGRAARRGHIVLTSSVYAFINGQLERGAVRDGEGRRRAARGALRVELAPHGAGASVAYFGYIDTEMVRSGSISRPASNGPKR